MKIYNTFFLQEKVEGKTCNQCKQGYFGLSASNPAGCVDCYCSGLTTICSEATGYRLHTVCNLAIGRERLFLVEGFQFKLTDFLENDFCDGLDAKLLKISKILIHSSDPILSVTFFYAKILRRIFEHIVQNPNITR